MRVADCVRVHVCRCVCVCVCVRACVRACVPASNVNTAHRCARCRGHSLTLRASTPPVPPPASAEINCSAQPLPQPLQPATGTVCARWNTSRLTGAHVIAHTLSHVARPASKHPASASASGVSPARLLGPVVGPAATAACHALWKSCVARLLVTGSQRTLGQHCAACLCGQGKSKTATRQG